MFSQRDKRDAKGKPLNSCNSQSCSRVQESAAPSLLRPSARFESESTHSKPHSNVVADQQQLHAHCHSSTTGSRESPLIMALAAASLSIKKNDITSREEVPVLPDCCEDCKSLRCHDWMCELPVLQQTRGVSYQYPLVW